MSDRAAIIPDMPIFGSDGALVGTVDRVSGVRILVNHIGASDADQYIVPLARVAAVTDRSHARCPANEARAIDASGDGEGNRSRGPFVWLGVGVLGVALLYGATSMILRGSPPPAAPTLVPSAPSPAAPQALTPTAAATAPARATGPLPANRATIAAYLASDAPAPQRFALDTGFASGAASLDTTGVAAVRGIAGVMTEHLNTKIKLAASGGGLALRRAAAIKRALVGLGVADYRIATGAARGRASGGSGVELIVLAK